MNTLLLLLTWAGLAADPKGTSSPAAGIWEGALQIGAIELRVAFQITAKADGSLAAIMHSIDQGARDVPIEKASFDKGKLRLELVKAKAAYEGTLADDGNSFKGEWRQSGLKLPLELKRVEKLTELRRPQHPRGPFPYEEEEVEVMNQAADVKLAGTLTRPKDGGPFPCVILITGSGPQDRDETLLGHKPFLVLADALTRRGIAVLRCDDRGVGKSTGSQAKATSADFATDVRAQIAFLKSRREIDPKRIGLIGHSEGGIIAPMVAADNPDVAFIVLLAGTGLPGDELLLMQGQAILKAMKVSDAALKWQRETMTRILKLVRDDADAKAIDAALAESLKSVPKELVEDDGGAGAQLAAGQGLTSEWMRFFLKHDPRENLKKVRCPVLALNGEKDLQVPFRENLAGIEQAIRAGGNMNVSVRSFPGLNHLFQTCETGLPSEYGKIEETFAPAAIKAIVDWIVERK